MIQNTYFSTVNRNIIIAVIFAITGSFLFLINPTSVDAATTSCFFKTKPNNGKFYYEKNDCPSSKSSDDGRCYVFDSSSKALFNSDTVEPACLKYMVDDMNTVSAITFGCPYGPPGPKAPGTTCPYEANKFGDLNPEFKTEASSSSLYDPDAASCVDDSNCNFIDKFINPTIKFLSAGVGVVVTIMIIIGGIQYSSAGSDPQKITAAKRKIMNALIALLLYIMLFAILNWLIPGGIV
jgi:hypothetical protein